MGCDLRTYFGELAKTVPTSEEQQFLFCPDTLPAPAPNLATDALYVRKGKHQYGNSFQVDVLMFYARKETYRYLGLLFYSVVFHREPFVAHIELTHPASQVRHLLIENSHVPLAELTAGYFSRPYAFLYWPAEMGKHPFRSDLDPSRLPCLALTNLADFVVTEEALRNRDTVRSVGSDEGSARFAELLLNASRPESTGTEYVLEGEGGYRGIGVWSSEVTLFLPGHEFWENGLLD